MRIGLILWPTTVSMCIKNKIAFFLIVLGISIFLGCTPEKGPKEKKTPNVVFIAVDDLRPELGIYGNTIIKTPNLNKLGTDGVYFSRHYVQVPTCGASRYALMTGMRPLGRKHLGNNIFATDMAGQSEKPTSESFIHQLRRNGYYTVGMGKMSHSADGLVYGYEEEPSNKKEMPHSWDEFVFDSGKWKTGWNAFFGYADGENRQSRKRQVKPYEGESVEDIGYPDGLTAQLAVSKLRELRDKEKPFFLGVGFFKPHLPFNAPRKYWDLYDRDEIPLAPDAQIPVNVHTASLHGSGELNGYRLTDEVAGLKKPLSEDYSKKLVHAYYASVSYIDAQIGKILQELKDLKLEENTIVVVWGDHGWHLGNDLVWGKHTLFERALKSALLIKVPGADKVKGEIDAVLETVDIYPTLLELCDVPPSHQVDGESFTNLLEGHGESENNVAYGYFRNGISVRTDRYRLTKYFREQQPVLELYDHEKDPNENHNIAMESVGEVKKLLPLLEAGNTGLYE